MAGDKTTATPEKKVEDVNPTPADASKKPIVDLSKDHVPKSASSNGELPPSFGRGQLTIDGADSAGPRSEKPVDTPVTTPQFEYRKTATVQAEKSNTPFDWKDWQGNTMRAEAGDMKVTQPDGSISSVKPDIFAKTYSEVPGKPGEFAKTAITKAQKLEGDTTVNTLEGVGTGKKGDYMVTGPEGEKYIVTADKFNSMYKPLDTPVTTPQFEYRKTATVQAEKSNAPFDWKDWQGNSMRAEAGDMKVTQPDGSISSVKPDIFAKTYSEVPGKPGEFAKTAITKAQKLEGDTIVNTLEGTGTGKKGDYMVTGPEGEKYIVTADKFNSMYKPLDTPVTTPPIEYRKTATVQAEKSNAPFDWKDWQGNSMRAEAGDMKVTQPDGSISSVKPDIFAKTYSEVPGKPGEFAKTAITKAQKLEGDTIVNTLEGTGTGKKGDYMVTGPEGEKYIVTADKFNSMYKPVESPETAPQAIAQAEKITPPPEKVADAGGDAVFKPGKGFHSSETKQAQGAEQVTESVAAAMHKAPGERTPEDEKRIKELTDKVGAEKVRELEEVGEKVRKGLVPLTALAIALGAAGSAMAATKKSDRVTYGDN